MYYGPSASHTKIKSLVGRWVLAGLQRASVYDKHTTKSASSTRKMYFIQFEPVRSFACGNYGVKYRCYDVTKGPREAQYHGKIPYSELSSGQPMEFHLKPEQMQSGNSINGTFLGTYY